MVTDLLRVTEREPLEFYGARTGNCFRVAIALEEAGIPYRIRPINLPAGEQYGAEYLALNPSGKVPVIVAPGVRPLVVAQSNAIMLCLAEIAPGRLAPADDLRDRALVYERLFYFLSDVIAPNLSSFLLARYGEDRAQIALQNQSLGMLLATERFLQNSPFIAGDRFSLADIAAVTVTKTFERHIDWTTVPQLQRWYQEVRQRPSVEAGMRAFG